MAACPVGGMFLLYFYVKAKVGNPPWTRNGNIVEWKVQDTKGHAHEASLHTWTEYRSTTSLGTLAALLTQGVRLAFRPTIGHRWLGQIYSHHAC